MSSEVLDIAEPLEALRRLGGFYECPKDANGKRLGPLVGYAGRDQHGRQYVGDVYANFAKAEQYPEVLSRWAAMLVIDRSDLNYMHVDVCLGMPMGGILFANALADALDCRVAFAEKKVLALATENSREKSQLLLGRHDLKKGDRVVLVEDVVNNFSTTAEAVLLVKSRGAVVIAIAALLNRSQMTEHYMADGPLQVFSLVHKPFPEYEQDDPAVADDIVAGNVVLKPKTSWHLLPGTVQP